MAETGIIERGGPDEFGMEYTWDGTTLVVSIPRPTLENRAVMQHAMAGMQTLALTKLGVTLPPDVRWRFNGTVGTLKTQPREMAFVLHEWGGGNEYKFHLPIEENAVNPRWREQLAGRRYGDGWDRRQADPLPEATLAAWRAEAKPLMDEMQRQLESPHDRPEEA